MLWKYVCTDPVLDGVHLRSMYIKLLCICARAQGVGGFSPRSHGLSSGDHAKFLVDETGIRQVLVFLSAITTSSFTTFTAL